MRQGIKYGRQFIILELETLPKTKLKIIYALVVQLVKNLPAMQETQVWSLSGEDPLEKEMATPVFLPGKFHGQRSLLGYSPWGCKVLDTTEHTLYSSFQKVASTFIQESLTFLPQEGHLNTKSPCDIFMLLLLHALRMFPFCFSQIFYKLSRYSPWTLYFGIHEEKKKANSAMV